MIIISDAHAGTSKWQYELIRKLGYEVYISTYSNHINYLDKASLLNSFVFKYLRHIPTIIVRVLWAFSPRLRKTKMVICSFPPLRVKDLLKLPNNIAILLNLGHRFHIHFSKYGFSNLTEVDRFFKELINEPRVTISSMSIYDMEYFNHYIGSFPRYYLPVTSLFKASKECAKENINHVLIGPSHNSGKIIGFQSLQELNQMSKSYASKANLTIIRFSFIKDVYEDATLPKISEHLAVIIIPYSSFSISMVEIVQSGVPVIVPSDELLIDNMNDVRLNPIYANKDQVNALDSGRSTESSPNSENYIAQKLWIRRMYFNHASGILKYNSKEDLLRLVYTFDFNSFRLTNSSTVDLDNESTTIKLKQIIELHYSE